MFPQDIEKQLKEGWESNEPVAGSSFHHPKATAAPTGPRFPMVPKPNIQHHAHPFPSLVLATSQPCDILQLQPGPHSVIRLGIPAAPQLGKNLTCHTVSKS